MRAWPDLYFPPSLDGIAHPALSLFDSYKKERVSIDESDISMYVCGITPYDATHLGHAATYISYDLVHRYLRASGKSVHFVENITDIDDPLLERANRDGSDWRELALSQIELFISDMTALKVLPPQEYSGVVESMSTIIESINSYLASNLAYKVDEDLYLDLVASGFVLEDLPLSSEEALTIFQERGGDPQRPGKRHPLDPLLWRARRENEPSWQAPFGAGRPGWHVECVAIALNFLPDRERSSITIQGGGSDLFFPHHFMTAMQAKALTGKEFAQCYSHAGMIGLDGEKMSKSKGNLVFVSTLLSEGVKPQAIRLALMLEHYQRDRMWSASTLAEAEGLISKIEEALSRTEVAPTRPVIQMIVNCLADNVDTPGAIRALVDWCDETLRWSSAESVGGSAGEMSRALDTYLGLVL